MTSHDPVRDHFFFFFTGAGIGHAAMEEQAFALAAALGVGPCANLLSLPLLHSPVLAQSQQCSLDLSWPFPGPLLLRGVPFRESFFAFTHSLAFPFALPLDFRCCDRRRSYLLPHG